MKKISRLENVKRDCSYRSCKGWGKYYRASALHLSSDGLWEFCRRNYNKYLYLDQNCKYHNLTISTLWRVRFEFRLWTNQRIQVKIVAEMLENVGGDTVRWQRRRIMVVETMENGGGYTIDGKHMSLMPKNPHTKALKACERLKKFITISGHRATAKIVGAAVT